MAASIDVTLEDGTIVGSPQECENPMHPFTFLACTYNLWGATRWDERRLPLERFLAVNEPDILCVQELTREANDLIKAMLPSIRSVDDPFPGWTEEGNIFWNSELFEIEEYGAADIGILEELRRLFWVRLSTTADRTIVVATAHFSETGNATEVAEQLNVRVGQATTGVAALNEVVRMGEPVLFMGDFNDYIHPLRVLRDGGFDDSFTALGRETPVTYPALPLAHQHPELLDWMMHRGPVRPTLTSVINFYFEETPPFDHKPIMTTYQLL
jgi:endonuclease/exonuclease/phosphatase family metal-dependent hydrolase